MHTRHQRLCCFLSLPLHLKWQPLLVLSPHSCPFTLDKLAGRMEMQKGSPFLHLSRFGNGLIFAIFPVMQYCYGSLFGVVCVCVCVCVCIYTQKHIHSKTLMTITVLISVTGHVLIAGIYNYPLPLPIPYSHFTQQAPWLAVVLYLGDPNLHS